IGISKTFFPLAIHLSMNHLASSARQPGSLPLGARNVYALFRFSSQQLFFRFAKVFRGDRQSFSQGARSVYAPLCFRSQQLFSVP
ncbi:hypothetical protein NE596_02985, partial [Desulfovibrio desulfuricans]|uniref:hypothetical protein n=1 Tax=Desulfovibrio desulfuricans TaxID=876 RepID=UPI00210D8154